MDKDEGNFCTLQKFILHVFKIKIMSHTSLDFKEFKFLYRTVPLEFPLHDFHVNCHNSCEVILAWFLYEDFFQVKCIFSGKKSSFKTSCEVKFKRLFCEFQIAFFTR